MKSILVFLVISLLSGISAKAQLHLPNPDKCQPGLINAKHIVNYNANSKLKEASLNNWYSMASPTSETVLQTSIASDGSALVIFYREPDYSINLDKGIIKKWNGNTWSNFAGVTNQCHSPDIDIDGSVVVATWYTDGYDYGYGSNINGPWVSFTGTFLQNQYFPRAAMAMGFPYMSFTCKYSDGMPSSYDMLHIRSIIGVGKKTELKGGWREIYTNVGMNTDIAGDDNAWYCAYIQQKFLYVDKGTVIDGISNYTDLGDGFRMSNPVSSPEIVVYNGMPVVAWLENGNTELYIAKWSGSEWLLIGSGTVAEGLMLSVRMAVSSSNLYVLYTLSGAANSLSINRYDGSNWFELPEVQDKQDFDVSTADIAIYNNMPVVAYIENNQLVVKTYSNKAVSDQTTRISSDPIIKAYPNPVKNEFTIDLGQTYTNVRVKVISITGQVVSLQYYEKTEVIQGSLEAAPGIYLFEVSSSEKKIAFLKLTKE